MERLRFILGRKKSRLFSRNSVQPYGCFACSDNIFFRHFWFIESDGFVDELTIIKRG
jgi:hypothetical protein